MPEKKIIDIIKKNANPLEETRRDYDSIINRIGDSRFVLIGEATHGTHDFYNFRAELTKILIEEKNFDAVAVEADWPDAYRINRYVHGMDNGGDAINSLESFKRFPTWMWRNTAVLRFIEWLKNFNEQKKMPAKTGFYGIDLYSLHSSMNAVIDYLEKVDKNAAARARYRYSCFDHFGEDPQSYGYQAGYKVSESCEKEVIEQLIDLRKQAFDYLRRDGFIAEDEYFFAEQNARIAQNAEKYYRSMYEGRVNTWNLRDRHMMETLESLSNHIAGQLKKDSKIIVWAHNSHLGDASFTEMSKRGELNLGQLVRRMYKHESVLIGFTTNSGTVSAASGWGSPVERKKVRPALADSYEYLFHKAEIPNFALIMNDSNEFKELQDERLERAIGVIYRPDTERMSHYFYANLPKQFDIVIHLDETKALEPLEVTQLWKKGEFPETYPSGL